jgi:hypothetical protein
VLAGCAGRNRRETRRSSAGWLCWVQTKGDAKDLWWLDGCAGRRRGETRRICDGWPAVLGADEERREGSVVVGRLCWAQTRRDAKDL